MNKFVLFLLFLNMNLFAQDAYHLSLVNYLKDNHKVENPTYVVDNDEISNINKFTFYGNCSEAFGDATNQTFKKYKTINVKSAGPNSYSAGLTIKNKNVVNKDDIIVISFWAKTNSISSDIIAFVENPAYDKALYQSLSLTQEWTQYFATFKAVQKYNVGTMTLGFHTASVIQNFDIAGFTALNYSTKYPISVFPSFAIQYIYEKSNENTPWLIAAKSRIEELRKANLEITVKDKNGLLITDADVKVEMQKHAFGFGTALTACSIPGNSCANATYIAKLTNLDGKGHGFNEGVNENDLKWDAWKEGWFGPNADIIKGIRFYQGKGIKIRGHNIIWPSAKYLPDDIALKINDYNFLRQKTKERIDEMVTNPDLKELITEWDVINELTENRDFENSFVKDPNLKTGREIYGEIMDEVKLKNPDIVRYVNEYVVESGNGGSNILINRFKTFLDELNTSKTSFDGIGFQCHMGTQPLSMVRMEEIFNDFDKRYDKRMKVTEYDITGPSEQTQADYMDDFLTLTFSHPKMESFLMWGFWDGAHWKNNAPIYKQDWSIKPSGQAFIDKVFKEWWTNDQAKSNSDGKASFRPFKGTHKVTITKNGVTKSFPVELNDNKKLEIQLDINTATNEIENEVLTVSPNPSLGSLTIATNLACNPCNYIINAIDGKVLFEKKTEDSVVDIPFINHQGLVFVKVQNANRVATKKVVIE